MTEKKIKILKDGPYLVSGDLDLSEKIILPEKDNANDAKYVWGDAGSINHDKTYALENAGNLISHQRKRMTTAKRNHNCRSGEVFQLFGGRCRCTC